MSKSSGEFLRLQLLIDRGYHPLAYRLMCLQAHYPQRAGVQLGRAGRGADAVEADGDGGGNAQGSSCRTRFQHPSIQPAPTEREEEWTLKQVQGDEWGKLQPMLDKFRCSDCR